METIDLTLAGFDVRADLVPADEARAAALLLHGWTGSRDGSSRVTARRLAALGISCLVPDLPGHGDSEGVRTELSIAAFVRAAEDAWNELPALAASSTTEQVPTLLLGTSFGGYLAARISASRGPDVLVLRVPANYPDEFVERPLEEVMGPRTADRRHAWLGEPRDAESTAALRAVAAFDGPLFVQESGRDEVIPAQTPRNYVDAAASAATSVTHDVVAGAPHALGRDPEALARANATLADWIDRVLPSRTGSGPLRAPRH